MPIEYLWAWIGLSAATAYVANQRGRSPLGWLIFALVGSPVIAGAVLLFLPPLRTARETYFDPATGKLSDPEKICPDCRETVKADAKVCRFCRHDFA